MPFVRERQGFLVFNKQVLSLTAMNVPIEVADVNRLVLRARQGDAEAFGELCRSLERRLLRQAVGLCGDVSMAEDLAQETLVEAWKCLDRFHGQCQFFTWLCAILLNRVRNARRQRRPIFFGVLGQDDRDILREHLKQTADPRLQPDSSAEQRELFDRLQRALAKLPDKQREIIYLRFFVDDSLEGIAGALGCSLGTVKSRLFAALEKLRHLCDTREWREERL